MTSSTYCLIGVLLTTFFCDLSWSLRILRIPSLLSRPGRQLEYLNHASFELRFMSAVTDLPLQAINNLSVASKTELSFRIKEAKPLELASIVSLRVNVFFPEGAVNLVAYLTIPPKGNNEEIDNQFMETLIGAIEISPNDFAGTVMEKIGASRKIYVADLCIRQDARRIGVASSLLRYVEQFAIQNQYEEIYLHVEFDNLIARSLYIKNGYSEIVDCDWSRAFTMQRLHKPPDSYVMLWKSLSQSMDVVKEIPIR